jgi:hypothetical protein
MHYYGLAFHRISVEPNGHSLGRICYFEQPDSWARLVSIMAGPFAESVFCGVPFKLEACLNEASDTYQIVDLVEKYGFDLRTAAFHTECVVKSQWPRIVNVANWLSRIHELNFTDFKLALEN